MSEDFLKRDGVEKLLRSPSGREYLSKLQKKHEIDLLQPSDPRFERVYGAKVRKAAADRKRNEEISKDMWERSRHARESTKGVDERKRFTL